MALTIQKTPRKLHEKCVPRKDLFYQELKVDKGSQFTC